MFWIVDGNLWLLLLLLLVLLLQPPFGTSRQFLIVVGDTKRPAFRIWNGHFVSDGAGLFGALAPILRIIDRNFGHGSCSSNRSWRRSRSIMATIALSVVSNCSPTRRLATSIAAITSLRSWQRRISFARVRCRIMLG